MDTKTRAGPVGEPTSAAGPILPLVAPRARSRLPGPVGIGALWDAIAFSMKERLFQDPENAEIGHTC